MDIFKLKKLGLFAGGVLFGTAGVKILGSEDAKKFYVNCVAARTSCTWLCDDHRYQYSGERWGHPGWGKADNEARGYESFGEDEDFNETAEATEAAPEAEKAEQ